MWLFKIYDDKKESHYYQTITGANRGRLAYGVDKIFGLLEVDLSEEKIQEYLQIELEKVNKK